MRNYGCVSNISLIAACALPDAGQPAKAPMPDASKLDSLAMDPPDGANLRPEGPPGKYSGS